MESVDLEDVARRPQRYWNVDGLPELVMGLLWMVWGGTWLLGQRIPRGSVYNLFWLFIPALLAFSGVAVVWVIRALKARITFPRTGYVAWREPSRFARLVTAGLVMVMAMVLAAAVVRMKNDAAASQVATPVLAVVLSLGFVAASVRQHAPHFLALAGATVALGLTLTAWSAGWESVNWLFTALGALCAAAGGVRLALFMRKHPRNATEGA